MNIEQFLTRSNSANSILSNFLYDLSGWQPNCRATTLMLYILFPNLPTFNWREEFFSVVCWNFRIFQEDEPLKFNLIIQLALECTFFCYFFHFLSLSHSSNISITEFGEITLTGHCLMCIPDNNFPLLCPTTHIRVGLAKWTMDSHKTLKWCPCFFDIQMLFLW